MGPSYGGPFHSVRRLAQEQALAGWDVHVRMPFSVEAFKHKDQWEPVHCLVEGSVSPGGLGWSREIARTLPQSNAEVLHTHGLWMHASWVALAWKRRSNRPHVTSVRGMLEPWAWSHHAWKKRPIWWLLEKRNLASASLLHATSDQEAQSFRNRGLQAPIAIIPNGVDIPEMPALPHEDSPALTKTALFLSRLHPKKGLPMLIDSWAKIRPQGWRLQIVGPDEGGHRAEIESLIHSKGLTEVVQLTGPLEGPEKSQAYFDSRLFILPTHSENFGIAVAEALAHGLPVITTHGAPWKLLETERCGWWIPVDSDALASALHTATSTPNEELSAMGRRGQRAMRARFGWTAISTEMLRCYDWLLKRGDKPDCIVEH